MIILKTHKVSELKESFSTVFPGLKIEFYTFEHGVLEGSKSKSISTDMILMDVYPNMKEGSINLEKNQTVAHFEAEMRLKFGLYIQVFRRSAELWLQTIATDYWTLETQNNKGLKSISVI